MQQEDADIELIGLVAEVFASAGWSPTRRVPIEKWTAQMSAAGLAVSAVAEKLLANVGGLRITPPKRPGRNVFEPEPFLLDPAAASSEWDRIPEWERALETRLCPLGELARGALILVAPPGQIISGWMRELELIGNTLQEAAEVLVLAERRGERLWSSAYGDETSAPADA